MLLIVIGFVAFLAMKGDKVYLQLNDNFDFDIAHLKMLRIIVFCLIGLRRFCFWAELTVLLLF